ncbi:PP2C family protein-serine/threonine phosphatase [Paenibacillus naphthalenovorans]|uniref:PPM-type phosphatase domain-containing protein n=1 Tax=Paenibacillus naphthalenovorans TaxID=162209 RepID=A0A0U2IMD0_9BACL|nr:PP2C family serine/threonine-protein phosphatase [Paenibacillus naphthalenovorans]ALS22459.1 PPM-type phosphatase domain-containing protein [Paenibacillus naphthalenovorans]
MKKTIAVHWRYGAATHSGWFRTWNEDRSLLRMGTSREGKPYAAAAIADGMGGTADGGWASEIAVQRVKAWFDNRLPQLVSADALTALAQEGEALFRSINREIRDAAIQRNDALGTTLTLLLLVEPVYTIVHVGDCRIYRLKPNGQCGRLTRDHSWAAEQVRRGRMSAKRARTHPKRHVLLQSLGMRKDPDIYIRSGLYSAHTLFLVTSDGFHNLYSDPSVASMLRKLRQSGMDAQEMCDELLSRALSKKSEDNISLLLLEPSGTAPVSVRRRVNVHFQLSILFLKRMLGVFSVILRKWKSGFQ